MEMRMSSLVGLIAIVLVVLIGAIGLVMGLTKIEPGYAGVVYSPSGGIEKHVLNQGWHFVSPLKSVTEYPISTETVYLTKSKQEGSDEDDSFDVSTKDGKNVNVDVIYSYHMDPNRLPYIFEKFRGQDDDAIEAGFIKDRLKESIQEVTTQYDVMEVYGEKRQELNTKVFNRFKESLAKHGIIIETFNFSAIRPDKESLKAIQEKVDAKQRLETLKVLKEQAQVNAEKMKIDAEAKAQAKLIQAKAEAQANLELQKSLNDVMVRYILAQKWDGKLPQVSGSENLLLNMQKK